MKYVVTGANRETGEEVRLTLEAVSPDHAEQQAVATGLLISEVRAVTRKEERRIKAARPAPSVEELIDEQATADDVNKPAEPSFSLITVQGKPLWFAATFFVGAVSAAIWFFTQRGEPTPQIIVVPPSVAQDLAQDTGQPVSTAENTGLGWSLADLQADWGIVNGWNWNDSSPLWADLHFAFTAKNSDAPWLWLLTDEPMENVRAFGALVIVRVDAFYSTEQMYFRLGGAIGIVTQVANVNTQLVAEWVGSHLTLWLESTEPTHCVKVVHDDRLFGFCVSTTDSGFEAFLWVQHAP